MASSSGFLAAALLLIIFGAASLVLQVQANCDVRTFNTTECPDIRYDSSEDFLYVSCRSRGTLFNDRYHLHVLLQYANNKLQCGDARHNFGAVCQASTLTIRGTVISLACNGTMASIDLSDCLGVDVDDSVLFSCDYDSYYN